jgi:hypothetical protein
VVFKAAKLKQHIAVFDSLATINHILKAEKTVEVRFSLSRRPPFQAINRGDDIMMKYSHGNIVGKVSVENVLYYDHLTPEQIATLRKEYEKDALLASEYWQKKAKSKFVTIIFLCQPERFIAPVKYTKKDRRSWVTVTR